MKNIVRIFSIEMKNMKNWKLKNLGLIIFVVALTSCEEGFLEKLPNNAISSDGFFTSEEEFAQGVNATYTPLRGLYGDAFIMGEMRSDNTHFIFDPSDRGGVGIENYADFLDNSFGGQAGNKYTTNYSIISRANQVLERIDAVEFDQDAKDNLKGQALFLRTFAYFDLVKYFGEVPLYLEPVGTYDGAFIGRSSTEEVYNQIIADAQEAAVLLPNKADQEPGRATSGAALTLLGDVYLNLQRYAEAETTFKQVTGYSLLPDYASVFDPANKNSAESIFEIQYKVGSSDGFQSSFFYSFLPKLLNTAEVTGVDGQFNGGRTGLNSATPDLINSYEAGDPRFVASIDFVDASLVNVAGYASATLPYCNKYFHTHANFRDTDDNWPVYRYAEVLLSIAEALNEQNKSAEALTFLNLVRSRVGLADVTETNQTALRDIIANERRVELAFENKRWTDLVRTGKAIEVMSAYGTRIKANPQDYWYTDGTGPVAASYDITTEKLLFPIPQGELDINSNLTQNPGY